MPRLAAEQENARLECSRARREPACPNGSSTCLCGSDTARPLAARAFHDLSEACRGPSHGLSADLSRNEKDALSARRIQNRAAHSYTAYVRPGSSVPAIRQETRAMKLYFHPLSGHSHRAHLGLSLLDIPHDVVEVDLAAAEHKSPEFLKLNPFGQIPVLIDGDTVIADSNAILVYAVRKSGKTDWLPQTPAGEAAVQRWLSVAAGEIAYGPCAARLVTVFGRAFDTDEVIARAHRILGLIDEALADHDFITGKTPTIADVALYSYIAGAPEGNVDLSGYPDVLAWLARVEALPGFVEFKKSAAGLRAKQ